ncbi:MAG: EamA/RhaT family transporter, partial [Planctomycetaceae bacterium]
MPLCSSVLVVFGLLFLKRAQGQGISTWTTLILVCWTSAAVFTLLTLLGGTMQPLRQLWQPAVVGVLFVVGQCCILLAVRWGDVSIATPVQGVKVLFVPAATTVWFGESMATEIWVASAI